jgi:uncharacterized protein YndB with AHSA1/START domain
MAARIEFSIDINAPREKVWKILWEDATYRKWTSAFMEGSYAVSDWKEGSSIYFLDPKGEGMYSIIERSNPPEYMSFKHIGELKDGKEQPLDEKTMNWSGGKENYLLKEKDGVTTLTVTGDMPDDFLDFFTEAFPKALVIVKSLSENE